MFDIYDILNTSQDNTTGSAQCSIGNAKTGLVYRDKVQMWQQPGLLSLPSNPSSKTDAPQSISIPFSYTNIIIAQRYVEGQKLAGNLKPGDTCLYANGPTNTGKSKIFLDGTNNSINLTNDSGTINISGDTININNNLIINKNLTVNANASIGSGSDFVAMGTKTQSIIIALNALAVAAAALTPVTPWEIGMASALQALGQALSSVLVSSTNLKAD